MSLPNDNDDVTPLFAYLLTDNEQPLPAAESGGTAPTYHCLDSNCTKKYPSDGDECTTIDTKGWCD